MSAPYIIPFNHQPVNVGTTAGTYTVPSGKYARVLIDGCVLPVLNGVSMCSTVTQSFANNMWTGSGTTFLKFDYICDRVVWSATTNSGSNYLSTHVNSGSVGASNYEYLNPTSFTKDGKFTGFSIAYANVPNGQLGISLTFHLSVNGYIWLKDGDVLSFTSGRVSYEEYNVIS